MTPSEPQTRRVYQCPGCWSLARHLDPENGWIECDCGERMTRIDLREAQGIPLIDVELLARAYEMGWTHGRDGESPNPRAAIEGVARLASESSIPVEEGER